MPVSRIAHFATAAAQCFGTRLHRHVFRDDPVPRLPPKTGIPYTHVGRERRELRPAGLQRLKDKVNPPMDFPVWADVESDSEDALSILSLPLVFLNALETRASRRDLLPGPALDDHSPLNYLEVSRRSRNER